MASDPSVLLHMCGRAEWEMALESGLHRPASLADAGFIHLSTAEQVHLPANRLYAGRFDLVLLYLKVSLLAVPVRWEAGVPSDPEWMSFPHLYGPLPTYAVIAVTPYLPGRDGSFAPLSGVR